MKNKRNVTVLMNMPNVKDGYKSHSINVNKIHNREESRNHFKHKPYSYDFGKEEKDE